MRAKLLIAGMLAAASLAACADTPAKPKWSAHGTVLSVTAECAGGWQGCHLYDVVFKEDDTSGYYGEIYTIGRVYGPPPVWQGFHGGIRQENECGSCDEGRKLTAWETPKR
jgi:hypothetical protein